MHFCPQEQWRKQWGFVAEVGVEKLYDSWNEDVLALEGIVNPPGVEEVL